MPTPAEIDDAMQSLMDTVLDGHASEWTAAWADAWADIRQELEDAITALAEGGDVPAWKIARDRRVAAGLAAAGDALEQLVAQAGGRMTADVERVLGLGVDGELAMIATQLPPTPDLMPIRPNGPATAAILARTQQAILSDLAPVPAEVEQAMRAELVRGIVRGDNPRETARRIVDRTGQHFNGGLARALNVSRTEMLDAMRAGQHATDQANGGVLSGWIWSAHLDSRTCRSCIGMHGTVHPITEPGPIDHHQGRCARVPRTKTWAELGFPGIDEPDTGLPDAGVWFEGLSEQEQRSLLTAAGYDAWKRGDYPMGDWTTRRTNTGWRDSMVPSTPPKEPR